MRPSRRTIVAFAVTRPSRTLTTLALMRAIGSSGSALAAPFRCPWAALMPSASRCVERMKNPRRLIRLSLLRMLSEGLQKCDERSLVLRRKTEPELVARHRPSLNTISLETGRHVVVAQSSRVEPVLERRARAVVREHPAVPDALERRHLVIPGTAPRAQRQNRVRP